MNSYNANTPPSVDVFLSLPIQRYLKLSSPMTFCVVHVEEEVHDALHHLFGEGPGKAPLVEVASVLVAAEGCVCLAPLCA